MSKTLTKKKPEKYRRTIAEELLEQWRKMIRKNDAEAIAEKLGVSLPTINKALIYGCVHQQKIVDGINSFFADRIMNEKSKAEELKNLQTA